MIFRGLQEKDGWMFAEYSATWRYGYDFMLDAAQTMIDIDFKEDLQRVATAEIAGSEQIEHIEEVKQEDGLLRKCSALSEETGMLIVSGISHIMECPIQIMFYNQTNVVKLCCPVKKMFEEHGEHVFDNYLNSIEIQAYCKDTERRTIEKML